MKRVKQLGIEQQSGQDLYPKGNKMILKDHRVKLSLHCTSPSSINIERL